MNGDGHVLEAALCIDCRVPSAFYSEFYADPICIKWTWRTSRRPA